MADTFKFTLYEVFGYFFPGVVALSGLALLDLEVFHHAKPPMLAWATTTSGVIIEATMAYILGHAVQIIANALLPKSNDVVLTAKRYKRAQRMLKKVREIPAGNFEHMTSEDVVVCCEHELLTKTGATEREIYVYREGFYRGMVIALSFVALSLMLGSSIPSYATFLSVFGVIKQELCLGSLLAALLAVGMYFRSTRFANYRVVLALNCHLLKVNDEQTKGSKDE